MGWTYCGCDGFDTGNVLPQVFSIIIDRMDWGKAEKGTQTRRFGSYKP
jgi:hypothetical protein